MERLIETINSIKEDVSIQRVFDKLAAYEDAEARGAFLTIPYKVFYLNNNQVYQGYVIEARYKRVPYENYYAFEVSYIVEPEDGGQLYTGIVGISIFTDEVSAVKALANYCKGV